MIPTEPLSTDVQIFDWLLRLGEDDMKVLLDATTGYDPQFLPHMVRAALCAKLLQEKGK